MSQQFDSISKDIVEVNPSVWPGAVWPALLSGCGPIGRL